MRFLDYIKELLFYSLEKKPSAVSRYQTLMISSALFLMCVCVCVCVCVCLWGGFKYTAEFQLHCQSKDYKTVPRGASVCLKKELRKPFLIVFYLNILYYYSFLWKIFVLMFFFYDDYAEWVIIWYCGNFLITLINLNCSHFLSVVYL